MKNVVLLILIFFLNHMFAQNQTIEDDFEGNGTITNWFGDNCNIDTNQTNLYVDSNNNSATVLKYDDVGGTYSNVRFEVNNTFDLSSDYVFTLKIYVPSPGLTGNQTNQVSLKLQDGSLNEPWSTQSEILKPIILDQWQTVSFDFLNDNYINLDQNSPPPSQRMDFNRVLIQVNGENNNDLVLAYIDDFYYNGTVAVDPIYDTLIWSDEFDGEGAIDSSKWHHQTLLPNGSSWYNNEIQHYTDRIDNSNISNGVLNIVGKKEVYNSQGVTKQYTSARLNSKFAFQYGKIEIRAKLPSGIGTWPAIWTLGKNINENGAYWYNQGYGTTSWPACGEIDIMEHWGYNQNYIQSATHTPSSYGGTLNIGGQVIPTASSEFHIYTLLWYPDRLIFSVDGNIHYIYKPIELNNDTWPFNEEQYLLLNFAILPDIDPNFVVDALEVEYVRVYQSAPLSINEIDNSSSFRLINTPNPAKNYTIISYNLPDNADVKLYIHNVNGQLIQTLIEEKQTAGQYQIKWNLDNLLSGIYFYTLKTENNIVTKKCIVNM
ncbi:MAG: family 16 glycosylhydrolase [Flavobacteriaceae bacterium]|nr:family 16 glycosylhydrolase [Flavobacteriaceae bacterium]MBT6705481.1 family 16 glycosylhydrolase [Flavobacteriaceae bacterium]